MPPVQDQGRTKAEQGIFNISKKIKNNPRPGQNLSLKIDWTRGKFKYKITQYRGSTRSAQGIFLSQRNKK